MKKIYINITLHYKNGVISTTVLTLECNIDHKRYTINTTDAKMLDLTYLFLVNVIN